MGKGRDKRKKAKSGDGKVTKKGHKDDNADMDAILEEYLRKQETNDASHQPEIHEDSSNKNMIPRANCALVVNPLNHDEAFLFGGEYKRGQSVYYLSDFYKFNLDRHTMKRIQPKGDSSVNPKARSSHQMAACSTGQVLLFGGEFGSPDDTMFMHHRDCWLFDPRSMTWSLVEGVCPPPRSGHRMVSYKSLVLLFGGFYDNGRAVKYLDDLWAFDCQQMQWQKLSYPQQGPSPRSGFVFQPTESGAILYGGYCMQSQSTGTCLNDMWRLYIDIGDHGSIPKARWERLKIKNPLQAKSGCSGFVSGNQFYLFGGVIDADSDSDEYLNGVCTNEVHVIDYTSSVKTWRQIVFNDQEKAPLGRFNANIINHGNSVILTGGIHEIGDVEVYLDDIWTFKPQSGAWSMVKEKTVSVPERIIISSDSDYSLSASDESDSDSDSNSESDCTESDQEESEFPDIEENETLREYFSRTQNLFIDKVVQGGSLADEKEKRKAAFSLAEQFFKSARLE